MAGGGWGVCGGVMWDWEKELRQQVLKKGVANGVLFKHVQDIYITRLLKPGRQSH